VSDHKLICVACSIVSAHALSCGSQVLYGSLVLLFLPMPSALGHKSSMGHLFDGQVPHKSSVGHLFRCGSLVLLSGPTQVLCGSLVSVWIICSLIRSHTSPLSVGHLFRCRSPVLSSSLTQVLYGSLVLFSVCACACVCVCVCVCDCVRVCVCVYVYRKFVQGDYSPCNLTLVERSECPSSSLECR
jgi:hypothetical protein